MTKKTVEDLMAEEIYDLIEIYGCDYCPIFRDDENACKFLRNETEVLPTDCIERLKEFYKDKADIPDGWDVVKLVYHYIDLLVLSDKDYETIVNGVLDIIKDKLQQAGIEKE